MKLEEVLARGRQAADILEAAPLDPDHGYTPDELAAQYAAADRLVKAFRELDGELASAGYSFGT